MKRLQVSILAIILVVAVCALAFTALRTASRLWYSSLYTFTVALLLFAVLAARFRRGPERAVLVRLRRLQMRPLPQMSRTEDQPACRFRRTDSCHPERPSFR